MKLGASAIIYINLKYIISLIDRTFLNKILSNIKIKKIKESINIKDINSVKYFIINYYLFNAYIPDIFEKKILINYIYREIYIVDNLKINILINIDIFESKCISIDVIEKKLLIRNYNNLIVDIKIKIKNYIDVYKIICN